MGKFSDKITHFFIKKIKKWMLCPICEDKMRISKDGKVWECSHCGYSLLDDDFKNDYVFWFCECCGTYLNNQSGFHLGATSHKCTRCGFENNTNCGSLTEVKYNAKNCILPSTYDSTIFYKAGINRAGISLTFGVNVETIPCYLFYSYWEDNLPKIKEIVFEDTSTWYRVYHSVSDGTKKDGTEEDVSDSVNNVTLFISSYSNYFWYKL